MNISGLFNISLRLLLDENSISRVNGLAGKGLKTSTCKFKKHGGQCCDFAAAVVTLSQLAFPGESNLNYPWEISHWDNTVVKSKKVK